MLLSGVWMKSIDGISRSFTILRRRLLVSEVA